MKVNFPTRWHENSALQYCLQIRNLIISLIVKEMRLELTRPNGHYPLKVARLPIPPLLHNYAKQHYSVPRTGLEPARLSTLAPETSASTIPPPGHQPRAENEARTRDPNLGKVVLYQLSYFRVRVTLDFTIASHSLPRLAPYSIGARLCSTN